MIYIHLKGLSLFRCGCPVILDGIYEQLLFEQYVFVFAGLKNMSLLNWTGHKNVSVELSWS